MGAGKLDGGGDVAAGGSIGDAFGGAAGVAGGGTATGGEGGGTTVVGAGGGEATTTGGGGAASGGGGGKEGGGGVSCGGGVDAEGRGGGAAGEAGGSAGVALGCVTGAGEAGVGVVVTGDGVDLDGGTVALMVPGEGEGEDAIGAKQARERYGAVTDELLPPWWKWRRESWHTPQFKGEELRLRRENLADSCRNQAKFHFFPWPLSSLSWRCKNTEEVKSHLDHNEKKLVAQTSTRRHCIHKQR